MQGTHTSTHMLVYIYIYIYIYKRHIDDDSISTRTTTHGISHPRKAEVAAIEAEAIANAHAATCQAEMVAARIQADAHAAEKARAEKSLASIKQDRLVKELKEAESLAISKIATAKAITAEGGEGGTKKESRVVVEVI